MSEGVRAINGTTDELDSGTFGEFLEDQADEWGEPDVGEEVLDLDIEDEDDPDEEDNEYEDEDLEDEEGEEDFEDEDDEGRNLSTDEIISYLEEVDDSGQASRAVRGMRAKMMQNINEFNTLKGDMLSIREEMLNLREDGAAPAEAGGEDDSTAGDLPQGVTQENIEVFQDIARHLGWQDPDEQEAAAASTAADEYSLDEMRAGVEEFGESFGVVSEDGESVVLNPRVQARLDRKLAELQDPSKGVTPRDLFKLISRGAGRPRSQQRGRRSRGNDTEMRQNTKGNVLRRTTSRSTGIKVRSDHGNDDPSDVFNRCFVSAKSQLTAP